MVNILLFIVIIPLVFFLLKWFALKLLVLAMAWWNLLVPILIGLLGTDATKIGIGAFGVSWGNELYAIGVALTAAFSYVELCRSSVSLMDTKRIETIFKAFLRLGVVGGVIGLWSQLAVTIYSDIFQEIYKGFYSFVQNDTTFGNMGDVGTVDMRGLLNFMIGDWPDTSGSFDLTKLASMFTPANGWESIIQVLDDLFLSPLDVLCVIICAINIMFKTIGTIIDLGATVLTRWIRISLHMALAPLALSTFACRDTSFVGKKFILSFISVSVENVLNLLIISLFPFLLIKITSIFTNVSTAFIDPGYNFVTSCVIGTIIINIAYSALTTLVKSIDQITGNMLGMGGA